MKIAFLGSTSQIAKDLIESFAKQTDHECTLFARNPSVVERWIKKIQIEKKYKILDYSSFNENQYYDVIINFVGVGDPAKAKNMGAEIFDVTLIYDMMVLKYLKLNPDTRYLFLSSGAVYGSDFSAPASYESPAIIRINNLSETDWYSIAKLYAEARHRALSDYSIIDIRVFNYFSHTQDINVRFLITDVVRALRRNDVFITSADNIFRDFIVPTDFFKLIQALVNYKRTNISVDCYTKSPVDKFTLLSEIKNKYGLRYETSKETTDVNSTGLKTNYYSLNKMPAEIGYQPERTALEGVLGEMALMHDVT